MSGMPLIFTHIYPHKAAVGVLYLFQDCRPAEGKVSYGHRIHLERKHILTMTFSLAHNSEWNSKVSGFGWIYVLL